MDRKIQKKKWTAKRVLIRGVLPLVLLILISLIYSGSQQSRLNVDRDRITLFTVTEGSFQEFIPVRGSVLPIDTLYLDSPEGGQVLEVLVEEGANVKQGQALLRLENKELELLVRNQEETVNAEINRLDEMRLNQQQALLQHRQSLNQMDFDIAGLFRSYKRRAALWADGLVPELDYINSKAEYEFSQKRKDLMMESQAQENELSELKIGKQVAIVARRRKDVALISSRLDTLILKAPVTGQLTSLDAEVGESKSKGQRLGMIDVLNRLKVQASIDEHYLSRLALKLKGSFSLSGVSYELIVRKIYPEIEDGSVVFDMEFYSRIPSDLRRGQTLHIRLELGESDQATLLARGGFYQTTGGNWVYVLDESGTKASRRSIRLGRQNIEMFEVISGLEPGEVVITSSYETYGDVDVLSIN